MRHISMLSTSMLTTFFLFSMVLNTSTTAAKVDPPQWTFDDKEAKDELKKWVNVNQLKPLKLDTVKDGSGKIRSVLKTESLGGDPYMFPGGGWNVRTYEPFNGKEFDTLYIGVRVMSSTDARSLHHPKGRKVGGITTPEFRGKRQKGF